MMGSTLSTVVRVISLGVVAENKELNTSLIQVHPTEILNLLDGELTEAVVNDITSGVNEDGTPYEVTVTLGVTLEAEWFGETNRITAPDVRRGEQVWIWQAKHSDKYYWTTIGRDDSLRRLETVIYRWSAFPDIPDEEIDADNSYYCEISTHNNLVTFRTSQRNGEYTRYTFQFNTGDGIVTLSDDLGNIITLDSAETHIKALNVDGSYAELNKRMVKLHDAHGDTLKMVDDLIVAANVTGDKITMIGGDVKVEDTAGDTIHMNGGDVNIKDVAGDSLHMNGGSVTLADSGGDSLSMSGGTITLSESGGGEMVLSGGMCEITAASGVTINGKTTIIGGLALI